MRTHTTHATIGLSGLRRLQGTPPRHRHTLVRKLVTTLTALSLKQDAFVTTYLANGGNATQAYIDAGYKHRNENVAASGASHLLQTVKISQEIATRKRIAATIASRNEVVDHAWVVAEQLDMYRDSRANDDRNAASRALDALAKLCDLYPRHDASTTPSA